MLVKIILRSTYIFLLLISGVIQVWAQDNLQFIENKGQWHQSVKFKGDLQAGLFMLTQDGYKVILHKTEDVSRIAEWVHRGNDASKNADPVANVQIPIIDQPSSIVLHSHQYQMRLLNANPKATIIPEKLLDSKTNYIIGNDPARWASNCRTFLAVTYQHIYPNIDIRYYSSEGSLKYDFIVHPGGRVEDIALYFDGLESLKLKEAGLVLQTSVQQVKEMPPYSFQLMDGVKQEVNCRYEVKGNIVRFKTEMPVNKSATLVIDPTVIFSTFTGSRTDNWGYTATYDNQGNFYAGGIAFGSNPGLTFPTSNGAFQQTFQGGTGSGAGFDMAIIKFDPSGTKREYATYLGGSNGNEQPHSMVVDNDGNLVIAGRSTSTDYPTAGALKLYGSLLGNSWHIVVTKLNASGTGLIGSVRIGGKGQDGVNIANKYDDPNNIKGAVSINRNYGDDARSEVILDNAGNVYFASCTQSSDFPTTPESQQTTLGGTNAAGRAQDAVILKLSPNLSSVIFSVLFGGNNDDAAYVLALNPLNNNILVAGSTASTNFPGNKTGVKYPAFQGGLGDGFLAEFSNAGILLKSTYWGTAGVDGIYGVQYDKFGFPYIAGTTTGNWPVVNAIFNQPGGKQFIVKIKQDFSDPVYSTIFGTNSSNPNLSPTAFLVDRCENVYYSGWGGLANSGSGFPSAGTNGLPVTSDGFQKTTDNNDLYFFVMEKDATSQLYGSFFGQVGGLGEHVDGGTSRFDRNGVIYQSLCANCGGSSSARFPTSPGVWAPNNGTLSACNLAAVKIAFNLAGIAAAIRTSIDGVVRDTSGCVPMSVDFTDTLAMGKQYIWDFNDGSAPVITNGPTISHTFTSAGMYRVKLIAVDSSSCNIADSAYINLRVRNDKADLSFVETKLPPCTSLAFQFTNTSSAPKPFASNSFRWDLGDGTVFTSGINSFSHTYSAPGTYQVKMVLIDTNYCNEPDSIVKQIRIAVNVKAQFNTPAQGCVPYNAFFENTTLGGQTFTWNFGDGSPLSNQVSPTHLYAATGNYIVTLIAVDAGTCNISDTNSFTLRVEPVPQAGIDFNPNPVPTNEPVNFVNLSSSASRYKWLFGDGMSLETIRMDTVVKHLYNASETYNACLVAFNPAGCSDTACINVAITIIPGLEVPTAFSPNGDGRNDRIFVKGFGLTKINWKIYNRWGELVFFTNDYLEGWNGTSNGKIQPQDVYHYVVEVEFFDGKKGTKKGDITLLR